MIRKLKSGEYKLYSKNKDEKTSKRRNLETFDTLRRQRSTSRKSNILKSISGYGCMAERSVILTNQLFEKHPAIPRDLH